MQLNLLDRIGDWNPQLFRELKGRLNLRNIAIALATSLLGQLILFMSWLSQFEIRKTYYYDLNSPFCRLRDTYQSSLQNYRELEQQYRQLQQQFAHYSASKYYDSEKISFLKGKIAEVKTGLEQRNMRCPEDALNLPLLWQDHALHLFAWFSIFMIFIMLAVGTYMLIADLAGEERRGTLNFIRLSPQSTQSVLGGKLLGVPIMLYLAVVLALPLHLWVGLSAQIPLVEILSFWAVLVGSCAFFYSGALLFGSITSWFSGLQAWLGSGGLLFFLFIANNKSFIGSPADWLNLFSPSVVLPYLVNESSSGYSGYSAFPFGHGLIRGLQWFYFPIGATGIGIVLFALVNYGLWSYWIWQCLNRRFRNPNTTILSKRQSYLLTACFTVFTLGFALQTPRSGYESQGFNNFFLLLSVNLLLLVSLIAALSPHRQALQDWARYRHSKKSSLLKDLMLGDKSPAVVAIAINLAIACTPVAVWILLWSLGSDGDNRMQVFSGLLLLMNLVLIYATLTQLMLLMKTNKRALWATGTVVGVSLVPPFVLSLLSIYPGKDWGGLWLLTTAPWGALKYTSIALFAQVLFIQWSILGVLSWQLTRQLRQAGESASKALFAQRPVLPR
jgi:hypothetical protein